MKIGVPKEIKNHEYRVGLTPASVRELTRRGHPDFRPVHEYALLAIEAGARKYPTLDAIRSDNEKKFKALVDPLRSDGWIDAGEVAEALRARPGTQHVVIPQLVLVGEIELEAADPLLLHHGGHFVEDGVIHMLDHAVKAVVDHRLIGGVIVIAGQLVMQIAPRRAKSHVIDDGGGATTGGGTGTAEKIIATAGNPDIDVEVGVDVDAARHHVAAAGIDQLGLTIGLDSGGPRADHPVIDQQVLTIFTLCIDQHAVLDQPFHPHPLAHPIASNSKAPPAKDGALATLATAGR